MDIQRNTPASEMHDVQNELDSEEEDFELLIGFDLVQAKDRLFNFSNTIRLSIRPDHQREMNIEVGVNLSSENPWKQISKQFLEDHIISGTYEMDVLKDKLKEIEGDPLLLIGYVPHLSDETKDTFIIYLDEATCKEASEIIRRLEAAERKKIKETIVKYPRSYSSMGTEVEVDMFVKTHRTNLVDVEMQSVYPMRFSVKTDFQLRLSDDVRDGYVELVPGRKSRFDNVTRKRVDRGIQSGALRVTQDVQTQPVFPTNAWSQYLYEMETPDEKDADTIAEESTVHEEASEEKVSLMMERKKSKAKALPVVEPIAVEEPESSKQIEMLLDILEFNQIDLYRNDYPFIAKKEIQKYQTPYLEELCCFANIAKCKGRVVTSIDWHPEYSGVCVAAYGFNTICSYKKDNDEVDEVKRSIIESNPVLVWSFDDPLYPKLELEALREITTISFCPYDGDLIIGGTDNGQLIIWDITDRLKKVETDELLTPEQAKNRADIRAFLNWNYADDSKKLVLPAAISSIENSHKDIITSIKWLPRNYWCTNKGHVKEDRENKTNNFRYFVTTSKDGCVLFWNLDWQPTADLKRQMDQRIVLPDELKQESSPFKKIDQLFRAQYRVGLNKPIMSIAFDEGRFLYEPLTKVSPKGAISKRIHHRVICEPAKSFNPKMIIGSSIGELYLAAWEGYDYNQGAVINSETMQPEIYASVHDGPIMAVERNHFLLFTFISIGGNVFALWHEDYRHAPIFWRRRPSRLTALRWSLDRPCVFFLTCENGSLEIWDLHTRIDVPVMTESLGGNILTTLLQHKLSLPKRVLAIADFNTNLRILEIPRAFVQQVPHEEEFLKNFVYDEVQRKTEQEKWKEEWYLANKDIIDAKKIADEQLKAEKEKKEKASKEMEDYKARMAEEEAKKRAQRKAKRMIYDLPERLEKKWNEQNYKRLLKVMMERKKVDQVMLEKQTKILKDRMKYAERQKSAIKQSFARIDEDLATIRARLVPVEEYQATREELVQESVESILTTKLDYEGVEEEALKKVGEHEELKPMSLPEIHERIKRNRTVLSQHLGGYNIEHRERYERYKQARREGKTGRLSSFSPGSRERSVTFSSDINDQ